MNQPDAFSTPRAVRFALKAVMLAILPLLAAGPAAGQSTRLQGQVLDKDGKPFPDVVVMIKSEERGQVFEVKTDKGGRYIQVGLQGGLYEVSFKIKDQVVYTLKTRIATGEEKIEDVDFKKLLEQQSAATAEVRKKQEDETKKFENLKAAFAAGRASLDQARLARSEMLRAAADQRPAMQQRVNELAQTALTAFQAAEKAAGEKESNMHLIYYSIGEAQDLAGKYEEAVASYEKAIALKPTDAGYLNNLGNALARLGRIQEAGVAYEKSAAVDPANAANAWRNFGIVLYNNNKLKEAVEPLTKATQLDPSNAEAWYLLGSCLVASMGYEKKGEQMVPVLAPGTIEAYKKYLELAPNGRLANEVKASLAGLEAMAGGIDTKVKSKKK